MICESNVKYVSVITWTYSLRLTRGIGKKVSSQFSYVHAHVYTFGRKTDDESALPRDLVLLGNVFALNVEQDREKERVLVFGAFSTFSHSSSLSAVWETESKFENSD